MPEENESQKAVSDAAKLIATAVSWKSIIFFTNVLIN